MRLAVSISGRAEADLTHQYRWFLDNGGVEIAERFLCAFDTMVAKLQTMPSLGRMRRFRSPELAGMHSFAVGDNFGAHLIFYRASESVLSIERVMHGARDLEQWLTQPL